MTEIRDWLTRAFRSGYFVPIQNTDRETGKFPLTDLIGMGTWQFKTSSFIAVPGERYRIDASAGSVVMTLPTGITTDPDIEIQRLDPPFVNDVLFRTAQKINGQSGVDGVFAPASPQLTERLSFVGGLLGWLGQFDRLSYQTAPPTTGTNLVYSSDGDTNDLFYLLGTNLGTQAWSNPAGTSNLAVIASSAELGNAAMLSNRAPNNFYSNNIANQWIAWDLGAGRTIAVNRYTIRNRSFDTNHLPRNWALQGTNSIGPFDITGINTATWTNIDVRTNDATLTATNQYYTLVVNGSTAAYRYLRLLQIGANSNGANYFTPAQLAPYGFANF